MQEQTRHPCEALLQQWQIRREVAHYYFTALLRLSPDAPNAAQRHKDLSEKVFHARLALKHAEDQLQSCYKEHERRNAHG